MSIPTKLKLDDETFNSFLPEQIRQKSFRFFTPAPVAVKAAEWLSGEDHRTILDIGAGPGKFCLFGAKKTKSRFVGIEARKHLVDLAEIIFESYNVFNAKMVYSNVLNFPICKYRAFYFYNPFGENVATHMRLDDDLKLSFSNYGNYVSYTYSQLSIASKGSRLVTYHGNSFQVPHSYRLTETHEGGDLKFWIKEN